LIFQVSPFRDGVKKAEKSFYQEFHKRINNIKNQHPLFDMSFSGISDVLLFLLGER